MARQSTAPDWVKRGRGANLRREREAQTLSLEALAYRVGITAQQISKYERGESLIGAAWAHRFAEALDGSILSIFRVPGAAGAFGARAFRRAGELRPPMTRP